MVGCNKKYSIAFYFGKMKIMMHGFEAFKNKVIKEELRVVQNDAQINIRCTQLYYYSTIIY